MRSLAVIGAALALGACHGSQPAYRVGGSISGLTAAGLVLQNNFSERLRIAANSTSFLFWVGAGTGYNITVATQPTGQTCTVSNGTGRKVRDDINDIHVSCAASQFTVGGTISGLTANGLILQNEGGDDLTIAANATSFQFAMPVTYGSGYAVTVLAQPTGQSCSLANAAGTAHDYVSNVALTCSAIQFVRFEDHHAILSDERLARDPDTAAPLQFIFVNNASTTSPDGSYEHPYPALSLAEANSAPNTIIYIFPGDGTTTGMDAGITLQAKQKFWGAGISHDLQTSDGSVAIPAAASSAPKITNVTGNVITLATDNEISGVVLQNGVDPHIFGADPGSIRISANRFENGISVSEMPILITATTGPLSVTVDHNIISDNTTGAIRFVLNDAEADLSITDNTITHNGSGALGIFGSVILIDPNHTTSGNCQLLLSHNTIANNAGNALLSVNGDFNDLQVTASNNTITGNGGGGLLVANAANRFTLNATANTISDNGDHGIATGGGLVMGTADITVSNNHITGNTNSANGIALSHDGTNLQLVVTGNDLSGNDGSGILLYSSSFIENVAVSIENNTLSNNQNTGSNAAAGIDLEQFTHLTGALDGNTLSNNAGPDVVVSSTDPSPSACLEMSGNSSQTGYTLVNGTGIFDLAPTNFSSVNAGTITTIGTISAVQSCPP